MQRPGATHGAHLGAIVNRIGVAAAVVAGVFAAAWPSHAGAQAARMPRVSVMTRNVYLGADLELGVTATSLQGLVDAAGTILTQVDANDFRVRAKGLAREILSKRPDLVGLQEVALWRTAPCNENPLPPKAMRVRYDYLALLMAQLNRHGRAYRVAAAENEFDFEVYANTDANMLTSAPSCPFGSELNGRLTMRDVILVRIGRLKTSRPGGGHFKTLLQVRPGGVATDVTRGWARVDVRMPGGPAFRFVDAHLEAFDNQAANHTNSGPDVGNGQVRQAQARELVAKGGPASGRLPVILVGDLNSDRRTEVKRGDALAYEALLRAGLVERSTSENSCCLKASILKVSGGGSARDFDHRVDHIMTNAPRRFTLLGSSLTGTRPVNGYWDSDHEGLISSLTWN